MTSEKFERLILLRERVRSVELTHPQSTVETAILGLVKELVDIEIKDAQKEES